jgi:hypothetical protein
METKVAVRDESVTEHAPLGFVRQIHSGVFRVWNRGEYQGLVVIKHKAIVGIDCVLSWDSTSEVANYITADAEPIKSVIITIK